MRQIRKQAFYLAVGIVSALLFAGNAYAQVTTTTGTLPHGAAYLIEVPANWNGTLFLYSHGYVVPGSPNLAMDVGDGLTRIFMLSNGFALAGSSYATTGWAIHEALRDQIEVLDQFNKLPFGPPKRTIAWGHSLGGIITAGLIQRHPDRFDAALPMCGVLSGGVATWNTALDSAFAFNTLIAGGGLQVVNIANPGQNFLNAEALHSRRRSSPRKGGRAWLLYRRLAMGPAGSTRPCRSRRRMILRARRRINSFGPQMLILASPLRSGPNWNSAPEETFRRMRAWTTESN
jgi:pimeloyl-ACP methyl ester carboxylesterase